MSCFQYKISRVLPCIRREIRSLAVTCIHEGCTWFGNFGQLYGHLGECKYEKRECQHCKDEIHSLKAENKALNDKVELLEETM